MDLGVGEGSFIYMVNFKRCLLNLGVFFKKNVQGGLHADSSVRSLKRKRLLKLCPFSHMVKLCNVTGHSKGCQVVWPVKDMLSF